MTSAAVGVAALKKRVLPPLPTLNDILRMYNLKAKKQLSQNFILDPKILNKFAQECDLEGKTVVEVGPGPGGITRAALEANCQEIHVIEKDPRFIPSLDLLKEASGGRLNVKIGDCLNYNVQSVLDPRLKRDWNDEIPDVRLVGNLPFNVSTPLIIRLFGAIQTRSNIFSYGRVPMIFTFQHEVAHRLQAPPGDKERSRLSIFAQNYADIDYKYTLRGGAFVPPPDVDVGVVKLTPLKKPYIDLPFPFIAKIVTTIMNGKNKKIMSTAARLFPKSESSYDRSLQLLDIAKVPWAQRPIDLTLDQVERICFAYKMVVDNEPEIKNYMNRNLKSSLLTELKEVQTNSESYLGPKKKLIINIPS